MVASYYIDTSVLGGYFDAEFAEPTRAFWSEVLAGRATVVFSTITIDELVAAPSEVRGLIAGLPPGTPEILRVTDEARTLARRYIEAGVLSENHDADATHVAVATLSSAKAIISWNFEHLVNLRRLEGFRGVNLLMGYREIDIRTPREVLAS
jgi:predicted nucleic acid-binding protein